MWGKGFTSFWKKVSCETGREKDLAGKGREEASALREDSLA